MSSVKRKWEDLEDSDEEEPAYGKQTLPVANLPEDFDEEPMDGMQYLFMVRRDARQLPSTVRAPNPYEKLEPNSPITTESSNHQPLPDQLQLPSEEWRELFELRFQNFRKNFNQPTIHVGPVNLARNRLMPEKKDRDLWWAFLSGKPESEWNPSKKAKSRLKKQQSSQGMRAWTDDPSQHEISGAPTYSSWNNDEGEVEKVLRIDPSETLPSPVGTPVPLDYLEAISQPSPMPVAESPITHEEILVPREPTTEVLKSVDERVALHLLMYFTHWINAHLKAPESSDHLPTDSHARWIFCLLSRIDHYISADDMNLLRNLARACLALLKYIKQQEVSSSQNPEIATSRIMSEPSCWVIVSTVAGIWKQKDLWMDAEDILRSIRS
ncbi:survival motor neuron interacting protein 1-domain-containing protein [Flammula alnicola]|nr:survival motor neuron interacting protein 1-domain-containing protein [Flammula alnicola]